MRGGFARVRSVARHGRIDEQRPGVDAALQVVEIPESRTPEVLGGLLAAYTVVALEDDGRIPIAEEQRIVIRLVEQATARAFPNLVPVHGPIHASWLNQIEIYLSIVQRKALTPNDFRSLADVEERLPGFQRYYEHLATPFEWRFTKDDLAALKRKLDSDTTALAAVA